MSINDREASVPADIYGCPSLNKCVMFVCHPTDVRSSDLHEFTWAEMNYGRMSLSSVNRETNIKVWVSYEVKTEYFFICK